MSQNPGRYVLEDTLGQGAVATVVRVLDTQTGTHLAGKVLHRSHEDDPAAAARFAQEAHLLEDVEHPHLVRVFGFEIVDGRRTLLMELVDAPSLAMLIAAGPLPRERLVELALQIARGLAHAHGAGIIHRDLKPSNVLVAATGAKIADFGLARASSIAGVDRRAFAVVGTPDYMAPECLDPLAVDARTDLYALGCMIHEMATGRPPYTAATPFAVLNEHGKAPIPELPADCGPALAELTRALLAKSPADRPQSAAAVVSTLERIAGGETQTLALVRASSSSRCASCAGPLLPGVGVCLECGMPVARLEPGRCTVLVTGPGEPGDKIDSRLREHLCTWLTGNRDLGLTPTKALLKQIPRLPFTLVRGVSADSGRSLERSLAQLGLHAEVVAGGPWASPRMRKKIGKLTGRAALIALVSSWALFSSAVMVTTVLVGMATIAVTTAVWSMKRVTRGNEARIGPWRPALRDALARLERALPAIDQRRHRQGLRAAVTRATELARALPAAGIHDDALTDELAQAIDTAPAAAGRLDALDHELALLDRDAATEDARALLHERDTWSSRLLSLTATLESLAARVARARAGQHAAARDEALSDLRAELEALEEVHAR